MALNKAVLAAFKAATRLRPDIRESYKSQRVVEDLRGKLTLPDPRCRVDEMAAVMEDGYEVPLLVFTPLDIDVSLQKGIVRSEDHRGTILFFHGGGWANGDPGLYADACTDMAIKLERRVISVDYRRAPEYRFPRAVDDCYETARQLYAGALIAHADPEHVVLMGDSAGGNLAAATALKARNSGDFDIRNLILLYPAVYNDHGPDCPFDSVRENGTDYLLTAEEINGYMELYAAKPEDYNNPLFAPLLAEDLSGMPRTLVITAEYDPLRDEGEVFAQRLMDDGGPDASVECVRMLDAVHGYFLYPSILSLVRDTLRIMRKFLDGTTGERPRWDTIIDEA